MGKESKSATSKYTHFGTEYGGFSGIPVHIKNNNQYGQSPSDKVN